MHQVHTRYWYGVADSMNFHFLILVKNKPVVRNGICNRQTPVSTQFPDFKIGK